MVLVMKRVIDKVDCCNTCPFSFRTDLRWWCLHPLSGYKGGRKLKMSDTDIENDKIPEWCPLISTSVLIKFVGKNEKE